MIICDVTEFFIDKYVRYSPRTQEQMRQTARSCKQNIVEGAGDKTVSFQMCINLMGVAKSSARELLEDYSDFLRQHELEIWNKDDPRTIQTRKYCIKNDDATNFVKKCKERSAETLANIMLTQLRQIDNMLAHVLKKLEKEFLSQWGIKEAMSKSKTRFHSEWWESLIVNSIRLYKFDICCYSNRVKNDYRNLLVAEAMKVMSLMTIIKAATFIK